MKPHTVIPTLMTRRHLYQAQAPKWVLLAEVRKHLSFEESPRIGQKGPPRFEITGSPHQMDEMHSSGSLSTEQPKRWVLEGPWARKTLTARNFSPRIPNKTQPLSPEILNHYKPSKPPHPVSDRGEAHLLLQTLAKLCAKACDLFLSLGLAVEF